MLAYGKPVAEKIKKEIGEKLSGKKVCFVIFGNDPASMLFIKMKCRFAEGLGIETTIEEHLESTTFTEASEVIKKVIEKKYDGIVVQLPLPKSLNQDEILSLVPPEMDIDVLSYKTKGLYKEGKINKIPPVARAAEEILKYYDVKIDSKNVLVIGRGVLVGEPIANMLKVRGIKFQQIGRDLEIDERNLCIKNADIIFSGAGDSHFIKPEMIKDGVVIIDAGTSESEGKIVGDVDPSCSDVASLLTPVPGGVGPVTLAALFCNLL